MLGRSREVMGPRLQGSELYRTSSASKRSARTSARHRLIAFCVVAASMMTANCARPFIHRHMLSTTPQGDVSDSKNLKSQDQPSRKAPSGQDMLNYSCLERLPEILEQHESSPPAEQWQVLMSTCEQDASQFPSPLPSSPQQLFQASRSVYISPDYASKVRDMSRGNMEAIKEAEEGRLPAPIGVRNTTIVDPSRWAGWQAEEDRGGYDFGGNLGESSEQDKGGGKVYVMKQLAQSSYSGRRGKGWKVEEHAPQNIGPAQSWFRNNVMSLDIEGMVDMVTSKGEHEDFSDSDPRFWAWSMDEMALEDVPAVVAYVLGVTRAKKVYSKYMTAPGLVSFSARANDSIVYNLLPPQEWIFMSESSHDIYLSNLCQLPPAIPGCLVTTAQMFGTSDHISVLQYRRMWQQWPSPTSYYNVLQWAQMYNEPKPRFMKFNYGADYDLQKIQSPVYYISGGKDVLAEKQDTALAREQLSKGGSLVGSHHIPSYSHMDFIWNPYAQRDLHEPVLNSLSNEDISRSKTSAHQQQAGIQSLPQSSTITSLPCHQHQHQHQHHQQQQHKQQSMREGKLEAGEDEQQAQTQSRNPERTRSQ
ncbi:hypothetical protein DUNSADRAFT_3554 [Dunaliella salina]|uniref:Uncharacterized protein n=1 Tax=Dunaliella salina TaxID=3046 RepID=A0ABQ7H7Y1_DUNSA|nr:hypothetical protein DUNSADRAFT_3554 [Dunaliella salina]|eukprot:KAF5842961.1 hypothetical protein DUNSADRAFT_3554 [Dunaliella salina]